MKLSRKELRKLIREAMGFGRDVYEPTGNIDVIRKRDPNIPNMIGYEIAGVIRGLIPESSMDYTPDGKRKGSLNKTTLDLSSLNPSLTHRYIETGKTNFKVDKYKTLPSDATRGSSRGYKDVYDVELGMLYEPWLAANNRQYEIMLIHDLVNTQLRDLDYVELPFDTFKKLTINFLDQEINVQYSGRKSMDTGKRVMQHIDVGPIAGDREIGFRPQFD